VFYYEFDIGLVLLKKIVKAIASYLLIGLTVLVVLSITMVIFYVVEGALKL